jgi:hypothetical protein
MYAKDLTENKYQLLQSFFDVRIKLEHKYGVSGN